MTENEKLLKISHIAGFSAAFDQLLIENPTSKRRDVYERLEATFLDAYGRRKYSCYESFLNCRKRFMDKNRRLKLNHNL